LAGYRTHVRYPMRLHGFPLKAEDHTITNQIARLVPAHRKITCLCLRWVDAVEKVPKYSAASFSLKGKTSGYRHSMGPQLHHGSYR
jgi:hypothetical protein